MTVVTVAVVSVGIVLNAAANAAARAEASWAPLMFWASLLLLFTPGVVALTSTALGPQRRLVHVLLLGGGLYLAQIFQAPAAFLPHDEFAHWRTVIDLRESGLLFQPNPLLPVVPSMVDRIDKMLSFHASPR